MSIKLESKLARMSVLQSQMKVLQAEYDMIKKELIESYFSANPEYRTSKGLVLATYHGHIESRFQTTVFETAHPSLYQQFLKQCEVKRFLIKKI